MEKNYKIIPFDVNRINEEGVNVVTRIGKNVRILCTDAMDREKPIVGLIKDRYEKNEEDVAKWTIYGKYYSDVEGGDEFCSDLFLQVPIKTRRMTEQELAWWLRDCPEEHREYKFENSILNLVKSTYEYQEKSANEEVEKFVLIRKNGGEWEEPLIEIND